MDQVMSADDELYLFESFGNLLEQNTPMDDFLDDDDENDIPLSDFLFYENGESECASPLDIFTDLDPPDYFFPLDISEQSSLSSSCDSPISLFPNFPLDFTYTPHSPPVSPTTNFPFEPTSLLPPSPSFQTPPPNLETPPLLFQMPPPLLQFHRRKAQSPIVLSQSSTVPSEIFTVTSQIPKSPSQIPSIPSHIPTVPSQIPTIQPQMPILPSQIPTVSQVPTLPQQIPTVPSQIPNVPPVSPQVAPAPTPSPSYVVPSQSQKRHSQTRQSSTRMSQTRHPKTRQSQTRQSAARQSQTLRSNSVQKHHATDCPLHVMFSRTGPIEADLSKVHFIDLKEMYEKTQVRRGGISEQRIVDGRVHMMAVYTTNLEDIKAYVYRFADILGVEDHIEIPVTFEVSLNNTQYFSINLDAVYLTSYGNRFYQLSTTDRQRKNRFMIKCVLTFADGSSADFTSEPFLLRSRKESPNKRKKRSHSLDSSY